MEHGHRPQARLYVQADLSQAAEVSLTGSQAHYLRTVLRLTAGAGLALFNGRDGEWSAQLDQIGKSGGTAVTLRQRRPQQSGTDIWLCFAPIKRPGIDMIAEKATELGAAALLPVITAHTHVSRVNRDRLIANAVEAAEQCERLEVPDVRPSVSLEALIASWPVQRPLVIAAEQKATGPLVRAATALRGVSIGLLVGPEGGFSASELDGLAKLDFAHLVSLGPRILRAETAALAALASWQILAGDGDAPPPPRTRV